MDTDTTTTDSDAVISEFDDDTLALTLNYFLQPHLLKKIQQPPTPINFITYKEQIKQLIDELLNNPDINMVNANPDIPLHLITIFHEFIAECNKHFKHMERMNMVPVPPSPENPM